MRAGDREPGKSLAAGVVLAWLLLAVACSSCAPRVETRGAASAGALDFTVVNFTRLNLHAIHVSPHDSSGWEENVLGRDQLLDGAFVKIRFSPEEQAVRWDLRVEDENGHNAAWKNLNLREISLITLRFNHGVVSAEAE
jgi:hypothetical protein